MDFYAQPAFFVLVALLAIPAIVLGCRERRIAPYGLVVSIVFLLLLFSQTLVQLAAFVFFLVLSLLLALFVRHLFAGETPKAHAIALYRLALALQLAPLVIYKVSALFDANLLGFIGISYLTFKSIQVLIETRDGLIEDLTTLEYFYFLVFFTPFTSGPIMRSRAFVADIRMAPSRAEYLDGLSLGLVRFLLGVIYKFALGALFSWLLWFSPQTLESPILAELAKSLFYGLYMFFDFAGYSLMAMGVGSVFGVKVPKNFNLPFISVDIKDFWNRWHISLSHWLRDFVFMRFSGAMIRRKVFKSRLTTACLGFFINFVLMGLWHGLTPDCLVYGMYHGLLLAGCEAYQKKSKFYKKHRRKSWYKLCSWALTMIAVFIGFSLFNGQILGSLGLH